MSEFKDRQLTRDEKKILLYLTAVQSADDAKVASACDITIEESVNLLDVLYNQGLIKGSRTGDTGWIVVKISEEGEQLVRWSKRPWYIKLDWKYVITTIIAVAALAVSIIALLG